MDNPLLVDGADAGERNLQHAAPTRAQRLQAKVDEPPAAVEDVSLPSICQWSSGVSESCNTASRYGGAIAESCSASARIVVGDVVVVGTLYVAVVAAVTRGPSR